MGNSSAHSSKKAKAAKKKEKGAARNYVTRTQALKKLQCTLADFRRLCILKGIYPREPRHRKKALKNATATTTFYYAKDIQYLLHEPVLDKLREHKAFAKKLSRALVRTQWGLAKNLEEARPTYRLDHIIKERYPTFADSLRDLDDALSLIVLFAHLPASDKVPHAVVQDCTRLAAEWQLYVLRSRSLRKVFLSIKGIYFQAEVKGQSVTWLVPYSFTQHVPTDIDFRVMLTFLEVYTTLLGFVFYKLYTEENLVYPPKLDLQRDGAGAGIGALLLEEANPSLSIQQPSADADAPAATAAATATTKDVRRHIKSIAANPADDADLARADDDATMVDAAAASEQAGPEPVTEANGDGSVAAAVADEGALVPSDADSRATLFAPFFFYLSREVTRPTLEFVVRSFGGQVGWDPILGAGSPLLESDPRITHHVVDRPVVPGAPTAADYPGKRVLVQPQWVVDSVNARRLLPTGPYGPGMTLPPHLSPFVDEKAVRAAGGYVPAEADPDAKAIEPADLSSFSSSSSSEDEDEEDLDEAEPDVDDADEPVFDDAADDEFMGIASASEAEAEAEEDVEPELDPVPIISAKKAGKAPARPPALQAAADHPDDDALRHEAELEAEARGVSYSTFKAELDDATKQARKASKKGGGGKTAAANAPDAEPSATSMLTGKHRKMYRKMSYTKARQNEEREALESKKRALVKADRKKGLA